MHRFPMDFMTCLVKNTNYEIRLVVDMFVTETRRELDTMVDSVCIHRETLPDPIADRNAVFHIKIKGLQCHVGLLQTNAITSTAFRAESCGATILLLIEQY
jgi:hypothetical protein